MTKFQKKLYNRYKRKTIATLTKKQDRLNSKLYRVPLEKAIKVKMRRTTKRIFKNIIKYKSFTPFYNFDKENYTKMEIERRKDIVNAMSGVFDKEFVVSAAEDFAREFGTSTLDTREYTSESIRAYLLITGTHWQRNLTYEEAFSAQNITTYWQDEGYDETPLKAATDLTRHPTIIYEYQRALQEIFKEAQAREDTALRIKFSNPDLYKKLVIEINSLYDRADKIKEKARKEIEKQKNYD